MGVLVTIKLQLEVTQGAEGILLEAIGQRADGSCGGLFTSAIQKLEDAVARNGGKPIDTEKKSEKNKFYRAFWFPNIEAIESLKKDLTS